MLTHNLNRQQKMKHLLTTVTLLLLAVTASDAQYVERKEKKQGQNSPLSSFSQYRKQLFNFDWKFQAGPADADRVAQPAYDDAAWRTLDLPHDFQFEQPWSEEAGGARGFKDQGEGWYRKTFTADSLWRGKQVLLDFGGIMYYGDVYINGRKVASTDYGYVGFEADITRHLHYDRPNTVAVYANTGKSKGSRWYTGGGLFRDVYLKVQNPTHVASHGIYITTPQVSAAQADVQVQVEVCGWQKQNATLQCTLYAPDGTRAGFAECGMPDHTKASVVEVDMPLLSVPSPAL